jgi:hypothetical protein
MSQQGLVTAQIAELRAEIDALKERLAAPEDQPKQAKTNTAAKKTTPSEAAPAEP